MMAVTIDASLRWTSFLVTPFLSGSTARCALMSARLSSASVDPAERNGVDRRICAAR
jgi:hypothetical protein